MTRQRLDVDKFARPSPVPPRSPPPIPVRRSRARRLMRVGVGLGSLMLVFALDAEARSHPAGASAHSMGEPRESVRSAEADVGSGMGEEDVRDVMHVMADSLVRLRELIALEGVGEPDEIARRRRAIDVELEVLQELGSLLDDEVSGRRAAEPSLTDHVLIDEHVAEFVRRVARARRSAAANPPDHDPAARVGGSCTNCHRRRSSSPSRKDE